MRNGNHVQFREHQTIKLTHSARSQATQPLYLLYSCAVPLTYARSRLFILIIGRHARRTFRTHLPLLACI